MAFSFFGGVHPKENKWYACDKETQVFPEPDIVVIPMSQHIGAPCNPLVKKGDPVTVGQKIGDNQGLCVPVHASVSGKVKAVEMRAHTSGTTVMSVVIENDHLDTLCEDIKPRTQEEVDRTQPGRADRHYPGGRHRRHGRCDFPHPRQALRRHRQGGYRHHQRGRVRALHNG